MRKRVIVRHTRPTDIKPLIEMQKRVYPDIPSWREDLMQHQLAIFPQGQLVAVINDELVGAASSLVVLWDEWEVEHSWQQITARGSFDTHNPHGKTLYGAEVFVNPEMRGAGIGHALYHGRRKLCRRMNLKRIIACGRLPGYHKHADQMSAMHYAQKVVWGDLHDPVLSFQLHEGFNFCGTVENYIPQDKESLGYAALIVWLNPRYNKNKPTLIPEGGIL